ncbi:hypothetical protein JCM8097_003516 [Rhodosporidiobolus ruineniae]
MAEPRDVAPAPAPTDGQQGKRTHSAAFSGGSSGGGGGGAAGATTAGHPRVATACSFCRKQKMKCEGPNARPCKRCRVANVECIFDDPSAGPAKSTTKIRSNAQAQALLEGRVTDIETRLDRLEDGRRDLAPLPRRASASGSASPAPSTPLNLAPSLPLPPDFSTPPAVDSTTALQSRVAQLEAQVQSLHDLLAHLLPTLSGASTPAPAFSSSFPLAGTPVSLPPPPTASSAPGPFIPPPLPTYAPPGPAPGLPSWLSLALTSNSSHPPPPPPPPHHTFNASAHLPGQHLQFSPPNSSAGPSSASSLSSGLVGAPSDPFVFAHPHSHPLPHPHPHQQHYPTPELHTAASLPPAFHLPPPGSLPPHPPPLFHPQAQHPISSASAAAGVEALLAALPLATSSSGGSARGSPAGSLEGMSIDVGGGGYAFPGLGLDAGGMVKPESRG